jgi:hypothetical protein
MACRFMALVGAQAMMLQTECSQSSALPAIQPRGPIAMLY